MIGLILAAGAGRRLAPETDAIPKTLVSIDGDRTILDSTLANFAEVGLDDVVIVVGYRRMAIADRVPHLEARHGVRITLVENDHAEDWNNAYSLWCARDYFDRGFILANGDTFHPASVEQNLLENRGPDMLLAIDTVKVLADEEMKVTLQNDGSLARITKNMDPTLAAGEYIGITLVEATAAVALAEALEATFSKDPGLYYEDGYQELVRRGGRIDVTPIGTTRWIEVDNPTDLANARELACRS